MTYLLFSLLGCGTLGKISDSATKDDSAAQTGGNPYIASETVELGTNGEQRFLIELTKANDVRILMQSEGVAQQIQLSIFSSEGDLLWAIETPSPSNETYQPDADCTSYCSFVLKAIAQEAQENIGFSVHILASEHEASLITKLP